MADAEDYGCGVVSVVLVLVAAACLLFIPLGMGPVGSPPMWLILLIPVALAFIWIYLDHASK